MMLATRKARPLGVALILVLLFAAACSTALPPVLPGPEQPAATVPPPAEPTQPAQPEAAPTVLSTAVPAVEATAPVTEPTAAEVTAAVPETVAVEATPAITAITGQVVYRQRVALAPDAVVDVVLQDTSRADAPAITLGSQTIQTNGAQVPIPFVVEYDLSQIDPADRYTMRATIKEGGQLTWTSTEVIPVITSGAPTDQIEITVQPVSGAQAKAEMGMIEGTVTYLQRIALPDNAIVEVTLEDVSIADAPAPIIAQKLIETNGKQVPIEFALEYDAAALDPAARYNLRVRIIEDGKLTWITTRAYPVLTNDAPVNNVEVIVDPVGAGAQGAKPVGSAVLEGTVTYLQRRALAPDAVVEVVLQDIAKADAPAAVIASQRIETKGAQVPIPFALQYDPAALTPMMRLSLAARITEGGKLTWISTSMNPVLTEGAPSNNVEIVVQPVRGS